MQQEVSYETFSQFETEERWQLILNTFTPPINEFQDLVVCKYTLVDLFNTDSPGQNISFLSSQFQGRKVFDLSEVTLFRRREKNEVRVLLTLNYPNFVDFSRSLYLGYNIMHYN